MAHVREVLVAYLRREEGTSAEEGELLFVGHGGKLSAECVFAVQSARVLEQEIATR
jgi:hypothetical protein